jgi:hypothetical protein
VFDRPRSGSRARLGLLVVLDGLAPGSTGRGALGPRRARPSRHDLTRSSEIVLQSWMVHAF